MSEHGSAEMCAKGVIFWGFWREKGGENGVFGASEAGKKAILRAGGKIGGHRGKFGAEVDSMSDYPWPENPLGRRLER